MTSSEKMDLLLDLQRRKKLVKIITIKGEEIFCKLHCPAEDEDDWAYDVITLESPSRYLTLECDYIKSIEEIKTSKPVENLEAISA